MYVVYSQSLKGYFKPTMTVNWSSADFCKDKAMAHHFKTEDAAIEWSAILEYEFDTIVQSINVET